MTHLLGAVQIAIDTPVEGTSHCGTHLLRVLHIWELICWVPSTGQSSAMWSAPSSLTQHGALFRLDSQLKECGNGASQGLEVLLPGDENTLHNFH